MSDRRIDARVLLQLLTVMAVALVFVPAGAHLFSMVSKLQLAPDQYMAAQRAYDGWAWFGAPIAAALLLSLWHTCAVRVDRVALALSLVAFLCLVAMQIVFWVYTYPMNAVSQNWTRLPADFEAVRQQWEYSHAAGAILGFLALAAVVLSALVARSSQRP
jgi:hypothetical protein